MGKMGCESESSTRTSRRLFKKMIFLKALEKSNINLMMMKEEFMRRVRRLKVMLRRWINRTRTSFCRIKGLFLSPLLMEDV